MKIFVICSKVMLGKYVYTYLKQIFETKEINRDILDCSKINEYELEQKFLELNIKENDVVINCVGTIKPMVDKLGDLNAILVNSVFPHILANVCEKLNVKLIHPTTDCVYLGNKGNYTEKDVHDIQDVYGRSKSLGEPKNCMVIRTSIIGEETDSKRSLVEWIKSQQNKEANGFNNHLWNGITCLEWAKFVTYIIETNSFWVGTKHIFSPNIVNKYELLNLVNEIYNLNINVNEISANEPIDRTLNSIYSTKYEIPNLKVQIEEMKNFKL